MAADIEDHTQAIFVADIAANLGKLVHTMHQRFVINKRNLPGVHFDQIAEYALEILCAVAHKEMLITGFQIGTRGQTILWTYRFENLFFGNTNFAGKHILEGGLGCCFFQPMVAFPLYLADQCGIGLSLTVHMDTALGKQRLLGDFNAVDGRLGGFIKNSWIGMTPVCVIEKLAL